MHIVLAAADLSLHCAHLAKLCRICGRRYSQRKNTAYHCSKFTIQLQSAYGISIANDDRNVHPCTFCHNCYCQMKRQEEAVRRGANHHTTTGVNWTPHNGTCTICALRQEQPKGGRPSKKGKQSAGSTQPGSQIRHLMQLATLVAPPSSIPSGFRSDALTDAFVVPLPKSQTKDDFICPKCQCILNQPLLLKCQHIICLSCCTGHFQDNLMPTCPACNIMLSPEDISCPPPIILHALQSLRIRCPGTCSRHIDYGELIQHDCACVTKDGTASPSQITLRDIHNTSVTKTPNKLELQILGHLAKCVMQSSSTYGDKNSIQIPTGGQVIVLYN